MSPSNETGLPLELSPSGPQAGSGSVLFGTFGRLILIRLDTFRIEGYRALSAHGRVPVSTGAADELESMPGMVT
jgi:hypothetical protein